METTPEQGDGPSPFSFNAEEVAQAVRDSKSCIRIFIAGAETHVGKTTVCLSLLAGLKAAGLRASEMAYIKPATQCEAPDLLSNWCAREGVEYVAGQNAPLVFYAGFTRSFLAGDQGTSDAWLRRIQEKVDELAADRKVVLVDGVGFPAVGSIVGVDNADVAKAVRAPVLLVCKCGVGAAVDSFTLNSTFFAAKGVPVLGAIFNLGKVEKADAYSWDKCADQLQKWFQVASRRESYYGAIPVAQGLDGLRERISETSDDSLQEYAALNARHFANYGDLAAIISDAATDPWCRCSKRQRTASTQPSGTPANVTPAGETDFKPLARDAVQASMKKQGMKVGGG